jgi:hypothetical protein
MAPTIMIVFTLKREVHALVDEYQDWQKEGLKVLFHSVTSKCHDAFILLEWSQPVPERFIRKLLEDNDVMDYLIFDNLLPVPPTQA